MTLLVIGIFALCGFALLTFFVSDFKISNSFVGADVLKKVLSNSDDYFFYKNAGVSDGDLEGIFNITEEYGRKYFYEEKVDDEGFLFFGSRKVLLFSVKYQVPGGSGF
ncbi:MAG: hypothetical protein NUV46_02135 [Nanoarchaeota archaeon]|nr:hypothetical protein [Nanoarchaeota archaeon]